MPGNSRYSNGDLNSGQKVRYSDHHLITGPFNDRTDLRDLNTGLVRYSDPHCTLFLFSELQILAGKQRTYSRETSFDTVAERSSTSMLAHNGTLTSVVANGDLPDNDRSLFMSKCRAGNSVEKETNNNMLKRRGSPGKSPNY